MHIAFLTPEYPDSKISHSGGLGTSIKNLVEALVQKGVQVTVFVYAQKENLVFQENGISFHLIADKSYKAFKWFLYRKHIQNYCNSIIKEQQIDLIEAPDWTGITAFMKFKVPLVIRFHGSDTYFCHIEKRPQKIKNFWFEKLATRSAKAFIAPTTYAGQLSAKLFKIRNKTIQTIHYGLALEQFQNENPAVFKSGLLLYIGTIIRKKGVFELPEIFKLVIKKHPNVRLVLIGGDSVDIETGSTSTWDVLKQKITGTDLEKISYLGKIPYQEVQEYIKKAQVCVFPSFAETLGMVTIESMALQKPVVNTNIGWAQELMIDEKSGYLVHPQDHILFANRIIHLLEDKEFGLKMGKEARSHVEQFFDIEKIVNENRAFYKSIINLKW
ncbi:Glycosyltransferase involved in cell wall bisynthesis [Flavobacterium gillisiae]|uniref:Glycosyltransferase involved in cell wall bisynthesis n=1 Tax=Flavobacterium gillisiae TaxID=150146 RepID=A0A1H4EW90_9FLAO|nr:glycosyltransferase family 4 protein [Flavobacterium gillisiae]SEA89255.1 Glycosyltransferase involved in cell wall bisynthesis [Flavobacterium gillisiae]